MLTINCSQCRVRLEYATKPDGGLAFPKVLRHATPSKRCTLHPQPLPKAPTVRPNKATRRAERKAKRLEEIARREKLHDLDAFYAQHPVVIAAAAYHGTAFVRIAMQALAPRPIASSQTT
jgi:hypothetical protein